MADSSHDGDESLPPDGALTNHDDKSHAPEGGKTLAGKLAQFSSGLSEPFIRRPVMTTLLTVSIIVFGILTYKQLAVNDLPAVDYPVISVSVSYPGANPETRRTRSRRLWRNSSPKSPA